MFRSQAKAEWSGPHRTPRVVGVLVVTLWVVCSIPRVAIAGTDTYGQGNGSDGALSVTTANRVVNSYTTLRSDAAAGSRSLSVNSSTGFATGDLVLVWQPTGYTGSVSSGSQSAVSLAGSATGRYELARLTGVSRRTLSLDSALLYSYDESSAQVVRVPEYSSVTISSSGSLVAKAWDGSTGGILAIVVSGTLTNNGAISASGLGFRGGLLADASDDFCGCTELDAASTRNIQRWAEKGEGPALARYDETVQAITSTRGRGNILIAGGGGDCDNAGGGGGGHASPGGQGGDSWSGDGAGSSENTCRAAPNHVGRSVGGLGGATVTYSLLDHLLFGGGGGAGQENDSVGGNGGAGGGVVWIRAAAIVGTNGRIEANGAAGGSSQKDGAGGGGAGGDLYVRAAGACAGNTLSVNGGAGGNVVYTDDHGPGGGGGAGQILYDSTSPLGASGACSASLASGAGGAWMNDGVNEGTKGAQPPSSSQNAGVLTSINSGTRALTPVWTYTEPGGRYTDGMAIGNLASSTRKDLVVVAPSLGIQPSARTVVINSSTGTEVSSYSNGNGRDAMGVPLLDRLGTANGYVVGEPLPLSQNASVLARSANSGAVWTATPFDFPSYWNMGPASANVTGDSGNELLVAGWDGDVSLVRSTNGTTISTYNEYTSDAEHIYGHAALATVTGSGIQAVLSGIKPGWSSC